MINNSNNKLIHNFFWRKLGDLIGEIGPGILLVDLQVRGAGHALKDRLELAQLLRQQHVRHTVAHILAARLRIDPHQRADAIARFRQQHFITSCKQKFKKKLIKKNY